MQWPYFQAVQEPARCPRDNHTTHLAAGSAPGPFPPAAASAELPPLTAAVRADERCSHPGFDLRFPGG